MIEMNEMTVEELITFMEAKLDEIRRNLIVAKIHERQVLIYVDVIKKMDFLAIYPTQKQYEQLEDIRARYLNLFDLYLY